jgi:hypothetical protein
MKMAQLKSRNSILILAVSSMILLSCKKIRVINYFIPNGFTGNVVIIYSKKIIQDSQQGVLNYVIPDDGILKSDYPFLKGNFKINFYQKNRLNKYDALFEESPPYSDTNKVNRIYFNRVLTFRKGAASETIVSTFYVGRKNNVDINKERFLFERQLEKLIIGDK